LVHGGEALARHQGQVVFLRGGAPGDLVEAELADPAGTGRFTRARVLRVLEPGASRVHAPCPIVDRCGGCPVQHVAYSEQLRAKQGLAVDALSRIGGIAARDLEVAPAVPSPRELRYRRRARLHRGPGGAWGFSSGESVEVVGECLLFEPGLQDLFDEVRASIAELGGLSPVTDLGLDTSDAGKGAADLRTAVAPGKALRQKALRLLEAVPRLRGLTLGPPGEAYLLGDPVLADQPTSLDGSAARFRLRSRPDLFAQANRAAVPLLQAAALEALGDAAFGRVLELYCGAGTLTLPLLSRARAVIGVEGAAPSLALLRKSAEEAGLSRGLRLVAGDAAEVAKGLLANEEGALDAVLLDPPRTGAREAASAAARLRPRRIVYVSCDAPTLGRDAKDLMALGYRLSRAVPLDLFPQTAHLELVATFDRTI
jgi:23S rRNA (uracil1939-C5)-methyltransferase